VSAAVLRALEPSDTVEVERLRHRLALGLSWTDALTRQAAFGPLRSVVETVGPYALNLAMDIHRADRHALRYAGLVQKRFDKALADFANANWAVQAYGARRMNRPAYAVDSDPRLYVPRRIQFVPVLAGAVPAPTPFNIRMPWLWPGSAYPLPGNATAIRGRLLRGPDLAHAMPIPWGRLVATIPSAQNVFGAATPVGYGHGDDRGEFVLVLDNRAVSGAALTNPVPVRLWPFLPPAAVVLNPADPLASLPLEDGGADSSNAVLRGQEVPAGYVAGASKVLSLHLGETKSDGETTLLFA
jgi:hypothetical protein